MIDLFLLAFLFGTLLASFTVYTSLFSKTVLILLICSATAVLALRGNRPGRWLAVLIFGLVSAMFYEQFFLQKPRPEYVSYYHGQKMTIIGEVVEEPEKTDRKSRLVIKIAGIKGKVLVNAPTYPGYKYGDRLKIEGELIEPPVFNEFNYRDYLKGRGIYGLVNWPRIEKTGEADGFSLKKQLFAIKNRFEQTLNKILPEPEASLAAGLVLGVRRSMPDWFLESLIAVGLIHIIALSGYNITVIAKNLTGFFNFFVPRLSFWFSIIAIWLFVLMAGGRPSIVRAALMGCLVLLAHRLGRGREMTRALLLTASLMLLFNPLLLRYDSGFQLSFLATAGLIYLAPLFQKIIKKWPLSSSIKEAGTATLSAQLFVLPLLLLNFKNLSLVALPANILVIPFIPLTMFFVFLAGVLGMLFLPLGQILGWLAFVFLKYIVLVSQYLSKFPAGHFEIQKTSILTAVIYWLVLGFFVRWLRKKAV